MEISKGLLDELLERGVDLDKFAKGFNETLNGGDKISKEKGGKYALCEKYYKEHEGVLRGVYEINGIREGGRGEGSIVIKGYSFWRDFLMCNGVKSLDAKEQMKGLVELKDRFIEWNNIRQEIYNRCVVVDNKHRFRIIHGVGLLLSGSGWEKDMLWLVQMGITYKGGILLKDIETVDDFRDLIRFRGLLGGVDGSMSALKKLGDMYDILDEDDVKVLNGLLDKYDDKKRAFLGNPKKRLVMN